MCLATVYTEKDNVVSETALIDKVQFVDVFGDELSCTNLFGEVARVQGSITRIDLNESVITIRTD